MAISLGKLKMEGERQATSRKLAKEYDVQQRKESKRKGWSSLLGGVGGKLLGAGIAGAFGIASGGLLMPLIMGASSTLSKKWVDEASKKMGYGADVSELKAGKYGLGRGEAKSLKEGLLEQMETEDWTKSIGKDIAMSYIGAGMSGKLGGVRGAIEGGGKEQLLGIGKYGTGTKKGIEGFKTGIADKIGLGSTFGGEGGEDEITSEITKPTDVPTASSEYIGQTDELPIGQSFETEEQYLSPDWAGSNKEDAIIKAHGGLIQNKAPTIADYFGMQGVSLGGSSKQSLAQILGR